MTAPETIGLPLGPVLSQADLCVLTGSSPSTVNRMALDGEFGPMFTIGRKRYVLRDSLLAAFKAREAMVVAANRKAATKTKAAAGRSDVASAVRGRRGAA